jgi:hypothetical protein
MGRESIETMPLGMKGDRDLGLPPPPAWRAVANAALLRR